MLFTFAITGIFRGLVAPFVSWISAGRLLLSSAAIEAARQERIARAALCAEDKQRQMIRRAIEEIEDVNVS